MSQTLGTSPTGHDAPAPASGPKRRAARPRRRWLPTLHVVALVAGVVSAGGVLLVRADLLTDAGAQADDPYPKAWSAKVQPFVNVVEDKRGLEFQHPVHVEFLGVKQFQDQVTAEEDDLTKKDERKIEQATSLFRAVGLIEGDLDLFDAVRDSSRAGILGYYSYEDERVRIRGRKLTPATESTLVHELTHALQDQHYHLGDRMEALEKGDSDAATNFEAIVEGDASRIESEWAASLSAREREELRKSKAAELRGYKEQASDVPEIFTTLMGSPYAFGEAFLALAVEEGGDDAVNKLFQRPPTTDEHLLDPWTLIADEQQPLDVALPTLRSGEKRIEKGPFGAIMWLFLMAERIPARAALDAAAGWGGDAHVAFRRDGVSCVRVNYRGDTQRDVVQMHDGLTAWIAALPGSPASVRLEGRLLVFESCDPGTAASVAGHASQDILVHAVSRTYLSGGFLRAGQEIEFARCAAARLVPEYTAEDLSDMANTQAIAARLAPCR